MNKIHLDELKKGVPGITKAIGAFLAEASACCLENQGHKFGVVLKVNGDFDETLSVHWTDKIDKSTRLAWADDNETTEYAATGLAILLVSKLTDYRFISRSRQQDRVDYFLAHKDNPNSIVAEALLEVSGILQESKTNNLNVRLNLKKGNIDKIPNRNKTAVIIVIAFNIPRAKIALYD